MQKHHTERYAAKSAKPGANETMGAPRGIWRQAGRSVAIPLVGGGQVAQKRRGAPLDTVLTAEQLLLAIHASMGRTKSYSRTDDIQG